VTLERRLRLCRGLGGVLALTLALAAPAPARSQTSPLDSVERYVRAELARQSIPGLSLAILRGDSVLLSRGFGYANVEVRALASDSTIYQSGSVGKQFTAAAVVMLSEEARLSLDDSITHYFPKPPRAWRGITIRHLLTHTSGIPDYADSTLDLRRDYIEDDLVRLAGKMPLRFRPGERWSYSNTGYLLLGILIHRVTGAFYGELLHDRIFAPAGMATTRIISEADIVPNRAAGYRLVDGKLQNQEWVSPSLNTTADGSLYFSVRDLSRWAIALNHKRIPSQAGLDASWTPVRLSDGGTYPYGFGWDIDQQRGFRRIGHGGSWQGFRTSIQRYPDFNLTVVVLSNLAQAEPGSIAKGVAGIVEPKLAAPHLLAEALPGQGAPQPIPYLLRAMAIGQDSAMVTSGLRRFSTHESREGLSRLVTRIQSWTTLGCDAVGGKGISRLGDDIAHICYVRGSGAEGSELVSVFFTDDWRVAFLDTEGF
jgi:CubicO group peptidase (beta-lactamase class C family)